MLVSLISTRLVNEVDKSNGPKGIAKNISFITSSCLLLLNEKVSGRFLEIPFILNLH